MMVSPISSVRFCGNEDMLSRPGAFTKPAENAVAPEQQPKAKKSKAGKVVLGTVITAAALVAASVALRKWAPNTFKVLSKEEMTNAKFLDKAKHYVGKLGQSILDGCSSLIAKIKPKKVDTPAA